MLYIAIGKLDRWLELQTPASGEFINRDLFTSEDFGQIQWRIEGVNKSQLKNSVEKWLKDYSDTLLSGSNVDGTISYYKMFDDHWVKYATENGKSITDGGIADGQDIRLMIDDQPEWFSSWFDSIFKFY